MSFPPQLVDSLYLMAAYALGCFATGYYWVLLRTRTDVRSSGSGSCGATNVGRLLGWPGFAGTALADAGKGGLIVAVAYWGQLEPTVAALGMVGVVAGHVWPVQLGFRGGKGIATYCGAAFCLEFRMGLIVALLAMVGFACSRNFKLAGLGAVATTPLVSWWFGFSPSAVFGFAVTGAIILIAHRTNIREEIGKLMSLDKSKGCHRP
jgi:acyl phosphate:glycerol-3-phosphate acyltransferase